MKRYLAPEMKLLHLTAEDILTTSTFGEGDANSLPTIGFGDFKF